MTGSRWPRLVFAAALASWLVFPILQRATVAQDGLAYVTAGQLFRSSPGAVYVHRTSSTSWRYDPRFQTRACHLAPKGTNCSKQTVPFLSAPPAIPVVVALGLLGGTVGLLLTRYVSIAALAVGMCLLRRRSGPTLELPLAAAALLMTPFAYEMSLFGQTSGLIFLAACIGLPAERERRSTLAAAVVWGATIAFKVFPVALVAVVVARRRWRLLVITSALLAVLTLVALPIAPHAVGQFLAQLRPTTATQISNRDNASIDAVIRLVATAWGATKALFLPLVMLRAAIVIAIGFLARGRLDDEGLWLYGWAGVLAVEPIVWWHYLGVIVVVALFAARRRPELARGVVLASAALVLLALPLASAVVAILASTCVLASLVLACSVQPLDQPIHDGGSRPP